MDNNFEKGSYKRMRNRAFSCSDKLWDEIKTVTEGAISMSTFIRHAVKKELREWENGRKYS